MERDFAQEWESESDGGLGTSLFALLCGRAVEVRDGGELRQVMPPRREASGLLRRAGAIIGAQA